MAGADKGITSPLKMAKEATEYAMSLWDISEPGVLPADGKKSKERFLSELAAGIEDAVKQASSTLLPKAIESTDLIYRRLVLTEITAKITPFFPQAKSCATAIIQERSCGKKIFESLADKIKSLEPDVPWATDPSGTHTATIQLMEDFRAKINGTYGRQLLDLAANLKTRAVEIFGEDQIKISSTNDRWTGLTIHILSTAVEATSVPGDAFGAQVQNAHQLSGPTEEHGRKTLAGLIKLLERTGNATLNYTPPPRGGRSRRQPRSQQPWRRPPPRAPRPGPARRGCLRGAPPRSKPTARQARS